MEEDVEVGGGGGGKEGVGGRDLGAGIGGVRKEWVVGDGEGVGEVVGMVGGGGEEEVVEGGDDIERKVICRTKFRMSLAPNTGGPHLVLLGFGTGGREEEERGGQRRQRKGEVGRRG